MSRDSYWLHAREKREGGKKIGGWMIHPLSFSISFALGVCGLVVSTSDSQLEGPGSRLAWYVSYVTICILCNM